MELQTKDYNYFLSKYKTCTNKDIVLYFEINLLPYRPRFYNDINFLIINYLLPYTNINRVIQPLYIYRPTIFFHALYTCHTQLIELLLLYSPIHYTHQQYSLMYALKLEHLPIIKLLIPHTNIHFQIDNTTPYLYAITYFESTHPIHILFKYINLHKHSLSLLTKYTHLSTDTLRHIKSFLI